MNNSKKGRPRGGQKRTKGTRGRNTRDPNLPVQQRKEVLRQAAEFRNATKEPTSPFGELVLRLVNSSGKKIDSEGDLNELRTYFENNPDPEAIADEVDIVDHSVWGYQFSKVNLYYLVRYFLAVKKLDELNPIRARVMGLISSISFYLQACAQKCLEIVMKTEEFAPTKPSNTASRMNEANQGIEEALKQYAHDMEDKTWSFINEFLLANIRFNTKNEHLPVSAFSKLRNSLKDLGISSAYEANKLFYTTVKVQVKNKEYSSPKAQTRIELTAPGREKAEAKTVVRMTTARRRNFGRTKATHVSCKSKYKLLGRYVHLYFKMTNGDKTDEKVDIDNMVFGSDKRLDIAFTVLGENENNLQFWEICKLDVNFLEYKKIYNIETINGPELDSKIEQYVRETL